MHTYHPVTGFELYCHLNSRAEYLGKSRFLFNGTDIDTQESFETDLLKIIKWDKLAGSAARQKQKKKTWSEIKSFNHNGHFIFLNTVEVIGPSAFSINVS